VIADRDDETAELTKYLASSASGQVSLMNWVQGIIICDEITAPIAKKFANDKTADWQITPS
jgi:hypothetical protein